MNFCFGERRLMSLLMGCTSRAPRGEYVTVHAKIKHKSARLFFELAMDYENIRPDEPS